MNSRLNSTQLLKQNIFSLSLFQFANYLLPLITLPYLARVLGVEGFGKCAMVQVVVQYLVIFTDYGFSLSATGKIAKNRENKPILSEIFISTWSVQWIFFFLVSCIFVSLVYVVPSFSEDKALYLVGLVLLFGSVSFPLWLFNGLEDMKTVANIQIVARLLLLIPLFLFVRDHDDVVLALLISGAAPLLGGVATLVLIFKKNLIDWDKPSIVGMREAIIAGKGIFLSRVSISIYTYLTPIILGLIAGPIALGHFSLADRIRCAAQSMLTPITQSMYPRMSYLFASDRAEAISIIKRASVGMFIISGALSLVLVLFASQITAVIGGDGYAESASVLKWLGLLPFLVGMSNLLGVQVMLPNQLHRPFNMILFLAAVLSLFIVFPLVVFFTAEGAAFTFVLVELFVSCAMFVYVYKSRLKLFKV